MQVNRLLMKHHRIAAMVMVASIVIKYEKTYESNFLKHAVRLKYGTLTNSGTNGAINAPSRATVDAEPTPNDRITVGSISAVAT